MSLFARGIVYSIASAVIFGFTPILTRIAYDEGANGITMTFLRAVFAIPVLAPLLRLMGLSFRLTRTQVRDLFVAGGIGSAVTTLMLYISYSYIPVGIATTLHFIYPIEVSVGCVVFFGDKLTKSTLFALVSCSLGVLLFTGRATTGSTTGVILSLLSSVTFAVYVIYLDKTDLKKMHYVKLSFYLCLCFIVVSGAYGLATRTLTFGLSAKAWFYALLVSFFTSILALPLLQVGIRLAGGTTAAILSTFEPITGVVLGVVVLGEELSTPKAIGCACILAGVLAITLSKPSREAGRKCETKAE